MLHQGSNKEKNSFDQSGFEFSNPYSEFTLKLFNFALTYNRAFLEATLESYNSFIGSRSKLIKSKKIRSKTRTVFDSTLRQRISEEDFVSSLTDFIEAWSDVVKFSGYDAYKGISSEFLAARSRLFEPIRDNLNRTPSEEINIKGKFNLHHYKPFGKIKHKTPLLVVYSLINRYYILDLMPNASVINNLRKQGFDIFATDWGIPDFYDKNLTLENYAHDYVENAVNKIKEITGSDKVSLFGYCWGGIFSLIYSSIHPENVKNLILHATPADTNQGMGVVENWTRHLDADKIVDSMGNVPDWFVNSAFVLRNPIEPFLKYLTYFSEPKSLEEILKFFWIETWLYDGRPIIGEVYREIVNKIYKNNLLIKDKMHVDHQLVDLKKITMPVLNIVGSKDDLVPPQSSKAITSAVGSNDKKLIEFPTGHIGLCLSQKAHEQLWPQVGAWLAQRS